MQLAVPPEIARLVDDLDLAVYVMQAEEQRCVFVSRCLERLLPATTDDDRSLSADPVLNAAHPEDRSALVEALQGLPTSPVGLTLRLGTEAGPWQAVAGRWASTHVEDHLVTVGILWVEPERKALAGDQLDQLSHDLRTPLNAVLGYAQLMGLTELQPDQRNSLDQVMAGGRRLLGVIERLESGGP